MAPNGFGRPGTLRILSRILLLQLLSCASLQLGAARALLRDEELPSPYIVELDDGNFDEMTRDGEWIVDFFAPWCGHCKTLKPVWNELAEELHDLRSPVQVASFDCTINPDVPPRQKVQGYPTIQFIANQMISNYMGKRDRDSIIAWIAEQSSTAAQWKPAAPSGAPPAAAAAAAADVTGQKPSGVPPTVVAGIPASTQPGAGTAAGQPSGLQAGGGGAPATRAAAGAGQATPRRPARTSEMLWALGAVLVRHLPTSSLFVSMVVGVVLGGSAVHWFYKSRV